MAEGSRRAASGGGLMADGGACVRRLGVRVNGAVQGVGFRPFVYRLASALHLNGFVRNDAQGVWIEVEGVQVDDFIHRLRSEKPALARIDHLETTPLNATGATAFTVAPSAASGAVKATIPADAGICAACVRELFEPADPRHLYPFIACCDCGPRFTMTRALPYDRPQTAMAPFALCHACARDYSTPTTRRFHAEPTACAACGPRYSEAPEAIYARLARGEIIAVKGVGGYHLMADARNPTAVARLRARKERGGKPFAVLAANIPSAARLANLSAAEADLLQSPCRPIVLVQRSATLPADLAPGLDTIGVMLPATALHWLLFWHAADAPTGHDWTQRVQDALFICTSANRGGEPLIIDDAEAAARLGDIADAIIRHDREIIVRADDPVARVISGAPVYLRRGRGITPEPIPLPRAIAPSIGFGAHMKAAVCVTRGAEAFLAQHVGDLDDTETIRFYRETARHLCAILDIKPERAACDLHPDFLSGAEAEASGVAVHRVQHHHAHAAACLAENRHTGPALALALDGYGYGPDGEAWGGELLQIIGGQCTRLGGLKPLPAPGGDAATRAPWRMAASVLHLLGRGGEIATRFANEPQAESIAALLASGRVGATSSCGRLFDAAAALAGLCTRQTYEAEAAMRLEAAAGPVLRQLEPLRRGELMFDPLPLLAELIDLPPSQAAVRFHDQLAHGLASVAATAAAQTGIATVALTGGCLANARLSETLADALRRAGLRVLRHSKSPPGDGGLALGQVWAAALIEGE